VHDRVVHEPLTIAVAQPTSALHRVRANSAAHADSVERAASRVVVFPELSLTGYAMDAETIGPDDDRLTPIVDACRSSDSIALVGAPVAAPGGGRSIGTLRIDGERVSVAYRKMFLGGVEAGAYVPGSEPAVIDVDGWRLGLAICKDTGVSQHAVVTAAAGIDAYVAGACEAESDRDVQPERARRVARDHNLWIVVAGFAGPTGGEFDDTAGRSFVMRPDGVIAARAGRDPGEIVTMSLDSA